MNTHNHIHHVDPAAVGIISQLLLALPFVLLLVTYATAAVVSSYRYKKWPLYRTISFFFGILFILVAFGGPLAQRAHVDFRVHMIGHLLLGMLAPLLIALASPMTLALRTLPVALARRLSHLLKSWPIRILSDPIIASLLNVGGLWILYTTNLYPAMQQNMLLHVFVHIHVFFAGYLFTISMIYIDPTPHRSSFLYRAIVFVIALAGHGILSKYIYMRPPSGVPASQADMGGMLMYYGGDAIDAILIFILCLQWFRATRPRVLIAVGSYL